MHQVHQVFQAKLHSIGIQWHQKARHCRIELGHCGTLVECGVATIARMIEDAAREGGQGASRSLHHSYWGKFMFPVCMYVLYPAVAGRAGHPIIWLPRCQCHPAMAASNMSQEVWQNEEASGVFPCLKVLFHVPNSNSYPAGLQNGH